MSKSKSPRGPRRDWAALLAEARAADRQLTAEQLALWQRGLIEGDANWSGPDYVIAFQHAIEGRDARPLLALLDAGMPIPRFLVPLLADVVRAETQGSTTGRPTSLTVQAHATIRRMFDMLARRATKSAVQADLAHQFGVSISTIKRSLARTKK